MVQSAGLINDVTSIPPARMLRKLNSGREPTMQFVVALTRKSNGGKVHGPAYTSHIQHKSQVLTILLIVKRLMLAAG